MSKSILTKFAERVRALGGVCAVNLEEPCKDDLRRVFEAYNEMCTRYLNMKAERDEWQLKYMSIELANKELSRNDHRVFGDLLIEIDELTKRCRRLNAECEALA